VEESEWFTMKIEDVQEADFRLANRLTPQGATAADNVGCEPTLSSLSQRLPSQASVQE
jgi:hypothetical protein